MLTLFCSLMHFAVFWSLVLLKCANRTPRFTIACFRNCKLHRNKRYSSTVCEIHLHAQCGQILQGLLTHKNTHAHTVRVIFIQCACAYTQCLAYLLLKDIGANLKPAKALGMTTIRVVSSSQALSEVLSIQFFFKTFHSF